MHSPLSIWVMGLPLRFQNERTRIFIKAFYCINSLINIRKAALFTGLLISLNFAVAQTDSSQKRGVDPEAVLCLGAENPIFYNRYGYGFNVNISVRANSNLFLNYSAGLGVTNQKTLYGHLPIQTGAGLLLDQFFPGSEYVFAVLLSIIPEGISYRAIQSKRVDFFAQVNLLPYYIWGGDSTNYNKWVPQAGFGLLVKSNKRALFRISAMGQTNFPNPQPGVFVSLSAALLQ